VQRLSNVSAVSIPSEKFLVYVISTYCMKTSLPLVALREILMSYHNLADGSLVYGRVWVPDSWGAKEDVVITFGGIPDVSLIWMRHQLCVDVLSNPSTWRVLK
jgi:hypothetical protein